MHPRAQGFEQLSELKYIQTGAINLEHGFEIKF